MIGNVSGELQYVKQEEIRKVSKGERVTRVGYSRKSQESSGRQVELGELGICRRGRRVKQFKQVDFGRYISQNESWEKVKK